MYIVFYLITVLFSKQTAPTLPFLLITILQGNYLQCGFPTV